MKCCSSQEVSSHERSHRFIVTVPVRGQVRDRLSIVENGCKETSALLVRVPLMEPIKIEAVIMRIERYVTSVANPAH